MHIGARVKLVEDLSDGILELKAGDTGTVTRFEDDNPYPWAVRFDERGNVNMVASSEVEEIPRFTAVARPESGNAGRWDVVDGVHGEFTYHHPRGFEYEPGESPQERAERYAKALEEESKLPVGERTSQALIGARSVLSRARTEAEVHQGSKDPEDQRIVSDLRRVADILGRWERTKR